MSEAKIISAVSALAAALSEAGLSNVSITVGAAVTTTVVNTAVNETKEKETTGRRGRQNAETQQEEKNTADEAKSTENTGGRGRGRGKATETDTKGRRGRGKATEQEKPKAIDDTPDQAEIRERLVEDLRTLADHDEAIDDVTAALANAGATNIKGVPSANLEALDEEIGEIFEKYGI